MEWISIKDKLPELSEENGIKRFPSDIVLIHNPSNKDAIIGYLTIYGWKEHTGTACGCCADFDIVPSHWMPFPEPPKD